VAQPLLSHLLHLPHTWRFVASEGRQTEIVRKMIPNAALITPDLSQARPETLESHGEYFASFLQRFWRAKLGLDVKRCFESAEKAAA
jgi:hypothetical protein